MVKIVQQNNKELYKYEKCGFRYADREWAKNVIPNEFPP